MKQKRNKQNKNKEHIYLHSGNKNMCKTKIDSEMCCVCMCLSTCFSFSICSFGFYCLCPLSSLRIDATRFMALKSKESFQLKIFFSPYVTTAGNQLAFFPFFTAIVFCYWCCRLLLLLQCTWITKYSIVSKILFHTSSNFISMKLKCVENEARARDRERIEEKARQRKRKSSNWPN